MHMRRVACALQQLGDRVLFGGIQPDRVAGKQHLRHGQHALRITAGHQRRARRRTNRRRVKARQLHPFVRHAIEVRRAIQLRPERPDVGVTEIVDVDDDEVRLLDRRSDRRDDYRTGTQNQTQHSSISEMQN